MKLTNTPYDDVFRTLLNDCSELIIPVINEVLGEDYTGKEEIRSFPDGHFLDRQGGNEEERILTKLQKHFSVDRERAEIY